MAYVQIGDRQYPLVAGENGIGSVEGARIPVPAGPNGERQLSAAIVVESDGSCVVRRAAVASRGGATSPEPPDAAREYGGVEKRHIGHNYDPSTRGRP